jgi:WD40 repeat protein
VRHRPGHVVGNHPQGVLDLLTLPAADGSATAVTLSDASVRLWSLAGNTLTGDFAVPPPLPVTSMTWTSSGGGRVVVAGPHGLVFIDPERGPVESRLARPDAAVTAVAATFVGDRETLVLGYDDGCLQAVDVDTWQQVGEPVRAHDGPVTALTSASLDAVVSAGADGQVTVWVLETAGFGEPMLRLVSPSGWANSGVLLLRDAGFVLAGGFSDGAIGWVRRVDGEDRTASTTDHEPAGRRYGVYAARSGGYSTSMHTGSGVVEYTEVEQRLRDEERRRASTAGSDEEREDPEPSTIVRLSGGVNTVDLAVVDDEIYLASGGEDGQVHLFHLSADPLTGENVVPFGEPVSAVRFVVVDGRTVLLAAESGVSGAVRAWPLGTGPSPLPPAVGDLTTGFTHIATVAGPDGGSLLAAVSADGSVTVQDAMTGAAVTAPLACPDIMLLGLHVNGWNDVLTVAAHGRTGGEETDAEGDGHAVVMVWQLRSPTDVETWDLHLPELEAVTVLVCPGPDELLAFGFRRDDGPVLWRLVRDGDGWTGEPVRWVVRSDDFDVDFVFFDWAAVVPGSGGRQVVLGGEDEPLCTVDLDGLTMTEGRLLPGPACVVEYRGRPSVLAVDGSLQGGSVQVRPLGPHTTDAQEAPAFESAAGAQLVSLTATPDGGLVVAGTEDGQLLVWEATGPPTRVIQIGSVPRRLAMCGAATVAVLTDLGLYSLDVRSAR